MCLEDQLCPLTAQDFWAGAAHTDGWTGTASMGHSLETQRQSTLSIQMFTPGEIMKQFTSFEESYGRIHEPVFSNIITY